MKTLTFFAAAAILAQSATATASVVYTNGELDPLAPVLTGYTINNRFSVSDSFTLVNGTTLASATVALESANGAFPTGVTWTIGSENFGSEYGAGRSTISSDTSIKGNLLNGYYSSFDLNATLGPGSYWLTLSSAVPESEPIYWLQTTNVTSAAYQRGPVGEIYSINSGMYFSLSDGDGTVPEPATLAIIGLGLAGIGATRRRK